MGTDKFMGMGMKLEKNGNGNAMMGMGGNGMKKSFPHTSTSKLEHRIYMYTIVQCVDYT